MIELPIRRLRGRCRRARRARTAGDAGLDLVVVRARRARTGERATVGTGLAVAIPDGYAGFVQPRSGLAARHGLTIVNTPGLVDSGYRGELQDRPAEHRRARAVRRRARHADRAARRAAGSRDRSGRSRRAAGERARRARLRVVERRDGGRAANPRLGPAALAGPRPALPPREAGRGEYWLLPGGGVNAGESLTAALHRELREEVGIEDEIPVEGPIALIDSISPERAFLTKHVVHIIFAGDLSGRSLEAVTSAGRGGARPPAVRAHRARRRRAPSADPALHAAMGAGRPGCVSRVALGTVMRAMQPLKRISIQGYRAVRELDFEPRSMCALVGEASSGKSTVLTAIWTMLEAAAPPPDDRRRLARNLGAHPSRGGRRARPDDLPRRPPARHAQPQPRGFAAGAVPAGESPPAHARRSCHRRGACRRRAAVPAAAPGASLGGRRRRAAAREGMERLVASNLRRFVLLIEEPELYLSPHTQRHLFRLLRTLAQGGNQILYSTHAPVFLSVDRIEELALVRHSSERWDDPLPARAARRGRGVPRPLGVRQRPGGALPRPSRASRRRAHREDRSSRLSSRRSASSRTRKESSSSECGGKGNMPLFARICNACGHPVRRRPRPRRAARKAARRVGAHREPSDPRGRGQAANGRARARLRGGVGREHPRPRAQAAEGGSPLHQQR